MKKAEFVFVVLVYKNLGDLESFLQKLDTLSQPHEAVVVESYSDDKTRAACTALCEKAGCDCIAAENRGYGWGNNLGIEAAISRYDFDYLIVCNPDIEIRRFVGTFPYPPEIPCVYGPEIKTLTGKRQNPCMVIASPIRERLLRVFAARPQHMLPFYTAIGLNKLERIAFNLFCSGRVRRVYSLHGSFLIFSQAALGMLGAPFDPEMFLFREEDHLARLARKLRIPMVYFPRIAVTHREDGSMKFLGGNLKKYTVDSLRVYFGLDRARAGGGR